MGEDAADGGPRSSVAGTPWGPEGLPFALSLQPCMHTFCAACYSGWMERSTLCPTCRCPVERICKNHILNNLVEAYLLQHPGKWGCRPVPADCPEPPGLPATTALFAEFQTRVAARTTCGAWPPGTGSLRTCCSPRSGGPSLTRTAVPRTCWSCRTWTVSPRMLGEMRLVGSWAPRCATLGCDVTCLECGEEARPPRPAEGPGDCERGQQSCSRGAPYFLLLLCVVPVYCDVIVSVRRAV